ITQPDGQLIGLSYDANGLPSHLSAGSTTVDATYQSATGNMQSVVGNSGERIDFTHDGSQLLSETWSGPVAGSTGRTLDNDLHTASRSVNGTAVNLTYDEDGLLTVIGDETLTRDVNTGFVTGTNLGSINDTRAYNGFGDLTRYTAKTGGSTTIFDVQYSIDGL